MINKTIKKTRIFFYSTEINKKKFKNENEN